jgi:hypothetical protein
MKWFRTRPGLGQNEVAADSLHSSNLASVISDPLDLDNVLTMPPVVKMPAPIDAPYVVLSPSSGSDLALKTSYTG